jgi:uncharacterized cupredoxin-like copper-binding protein
MQATTPQSTPNWLNTLGIFFGIVIAIALFVFTIGNMGLLNFGTKPYVSPSTIPVNVENFQFVEDELHLKAGDTVTFELFNADFLAHSFDVDEFDVHAPMPENERVTIHFAPTQPGTYTFYCGVPGHRAAGMVGTLVIEP